MTSGRKWLEKPVSTEQRANNKKIAHLPSEVNSYKQHYYHSGAKSIEYSTVLCAVLDRQDERLNEQLFNANGDRGKLESEEKTWGFSEMRNSEL